MLEMPDDGRWGHAVLLGKFGDRCLGDHPADLYTIREDSC